MAKINKENGALRVAHLLNIIGKDGQDMFEMFTLTKDDKNDIMKVLKEFEGRCVLVSNVIYERYMFNKHSQDSGESLDHYLTEIMKQADLCKYGNLKDELIRDRLVSGIKDDKAREKLLAKKDLTLTRAIEMLRTSQAAQVRAKDMAEDVESLPIKAVSDRKPEVPRSQPQSNSALTRPTGKRLPITQSLKPCRYCGNKHDFKKEVCPATDKKCHRCGKSGHFSRVCRSSKLHMIEDEGSDNEELFCVSSVKKSKDSRALATCTVNQKHDVVFEIDTGASCNVLPFLDYVMATGDILGRQMQATRARLTMHNNTREAPIGKVMLFVERKGHRHKVHFYVVKSKVVPILGKDACVGMGLVKILDCDSINMVKEASILGDSVLKQYADVFDGLGELPGEYTLRLHPDIAPVVHPPRKLPVALREIVKTELDAMTVKGIITPVTEPTKWVSSMVVVQKKNGKVRICLDPRNLNQAIMRSHYPLPTIEEVATRLTNAKVFSVLDAKTGFWQVKLDEASSYLTTFNTPFGRYRWKRMPFGINSAPEVWQQRMNEIAEGLKGVEVIADDFLVCGFGDTKEDALANHDSNLCCFLHRARSRGLRLNLEKVKLRHTAVPFIGHLLTDKGLAPDPDKVSAIVSMPTPTNVKALQEFLGMTQYLSKFLPQLSVVTDPLRQLVHKDTPWQWTQVHEDAVTTLKMLISKAPVLQYFDPRKEVTLQSDASESGLGFALLQEGQPVAFGARGLTTAEKKYAQIEKEMLAIVAGCEKFDQYIYGHTVTIETDHKPLVTISSKPIHNAPKRLQRMLLRLQRYDLVITYKKGTEMYLADALSRAYPHNSRAQSLDQSEFCHSIEEIDLTRHLQISTETLKRVRVATSADHNLQVLMTVILQGWPLGKSSTPAEAQPYFNCHDELSVQNGIIFRGERIVVPSTFRHEMDNY